MVTAAVTTTSLLLLTAELAFVTPVAARHPPELGPFVDHLDILVDNLESPSHTEKCLFNSQKDLLR